jgi:hypothetical protein
MGVDGRVGAIQVFDVLPIMNVIQNIYKGPSVMNCDVFSPFIKRPPSLRINSYH